MNDYLRTMFDMIKKIPAPGRAGLDVDLSQLGAREWYNQVNTDVAQERLGNKWDVDKQFAQAPIPAPRIETVPGEAPLGISLGKPKIGNQLGLEIGPVSVERSAPEYGVEVGPVSVERPEEQPEEMTLPPLNIRAMQWHESPEFLKLMGETSKKKKKGKK